ncbi:MAG: sugar 3,4-ketoisomerase [Candidatus Fonsibacter ubiquis]
MTTLKDVILIKLKQWIESNGNLLPIEFDNQLLFKPKRTFFVNNVPDTQPRGKHAHYKTKQLIICLNGKITVRLHDGINEAYYELNNGDSIYIQNMIWDEQIYHTPNTVLISLCNTHYNTLDYINDFEEFVKLKTKNEKRK